MLLRYFWSQVRPFRRFEVYKSKGVPVIAVSDPYRIKLSSSAFVMVILDVDRVRRQGTLLCKKINFGYL